MKRLRGWALLLLVTLVLLLLSIAQGWTTVLESANEDTDFLLSLSQPVMAAGKQIIIKHTSPYKRYNNDADFLHAAQELSRTFQLPIPSLVNQNQTQTLTQNESLRTSKFTLAHSDNIHSTLLLVGFPDGSTLLSLTAETLQESGSPHLQALQKQWTSELQALGIQVRWNVMIQGVLAASVADSYSLQHYLSAAMSIHELDRYEDSGSLSISYQSPRLHPSSNTGQEKMNLQVAVHRDSITNQQRITIATPAISIEY
jgi:hypothetical protein